MLGQRLPDFRHNVLFQETEKVVFKSIDVTTMCPRFVEIATLPEKIPYKAFPAGQRKYEHMKKLLK